MRREQLSRVFGALEDRQIAEAYRFDPARCEHAPERIVPMKKKRILAFALAAALLLSLSVVAYAAYDRVSGPKAAERVALEQLEVWQEMGLLSEEIRFDSPATYVEERQARQGSDYWYGRLFPHCFELRYSNEKYHCQLMVDTLSGKIVLARISAQPDEIDEPVALEPRGGEQSTFVYENFDDIFPPDLTVDDLCARLSEYWGFSGYRIGETVDDYFPANEKQWPPIDGATLLKDMPKLNPTQYYLTVFFEGDQEGAPMYVELGNYPSYVDLTIGNHHSIG